MLYTIPEWGPDKKSKCVGHHNEHELNTKAHSSISEFPFGQAPALYWDDTEVTQSMCINRFIARKTGLAGSTDEEFIAADTIAENVNDLLLGVMNTRSCSLANVNSFL